VLNALRLHTGGHLLPFAFYLLPFRVLLQSAIQNPKSTIQNRVSALRRSKLGHGRGQAIGARMHGSAPLKTEETIVGLPRLLVLSAFSRSDSPDLVAVTFHLAPFTFPDLVAVTFHLLVAVTFHLSPSQKSLVGSNPIPSACRPPSSRILKRMPGEGGLLG
jgi:hypothetical protein